MADYTVTTDFSVKDALSPGDPDKLIVGAEFDTEFDNIATAIATKYDSTDLASQAQAEAGTDNATLMTPLRNQQWADDNGGMVGDIQALADPGADRILFWDDSAGAVASLTAGTNLTISGTQIDASGGGGGDMKIKSADDSISSDDTLSDDTHLAGWSLLGAAAYMIRGQLYFNCASTEEVKLKFDYTGSVTTYTFAANGWHGSSPAGGGEGGFLSNIANTYAATNIGNGESVMLDVLVYIDPSTDGTLDLQWAQNISTGVTTSFKAGSWLEVIVVS